MNTIKDIYEKCGSKEEFIATVQNELEKLSKENPDFIYSNDDNMCYYNKGPEDNPEKCSGCIFGQALQNMGVSRESLNFIGPIDEVLTQQLPINLDEIPRDWARIQYEQDIGCKWGDLFND